MTTGPCTDRTVFLSSSADTSASAAKGIPPAGRAADAPDNDFCNFFLASTRSSAFVPDFQLISSLRASAATTSWMTENHSILSPALSSRSNDLRHDCENCWEISPLAKARTWGLSKARE